VASDRAGDGMEDEAAVRDRVGATVDAVGTLVGILDDTRLGAAV
jgi:hypothetical protein